MGMQSTRGGARKGAGRPRKGQPKELYTAYIETALVEAIRKLPTGKQHLFVNDAVKEKAIKQGLYRED